MSGDLLKDREQCFLILREAFKKELFTLDPGRYKGGISDFVTAAVYGTLTYCYSIDTIVKSASGKDVSSMDEITSVIVRLGAWQILFSDKVPDYAAVSTSVDLARKYRKSSAGFVNAVLRKVSDLPSEKKDLSSYKPETRVSLPPEIFGVLKKSYGKDRAISIGEAFLKPSPLTIRFDKNKISSDSLKNKLERDGFSVSEGHLTDESLIIVPSDIPINKCQAYLDGDFIVQGESAILASRVADPKRGDLVLDCCSAPGGKATHMAQIASDDLRIIALDKSPDRAEKIKENAERLGLKSIETGCADSTTYDTDLRFDVVLADVPCSGLGLLGRKPDLRIKLDYERIQSLIPIQEAILNNISRLVKPGGTLVYSTCSINKAENEERVNDFLSKHDDFYADDIRPYLPSKLIMDEKREEDAKGGMITLLPDTDLCDGFFIARLKRR
ncbi:MAG: 16S rRNA (cytosine(967)-C(5))-methyltransferase RsmB [Clostridiales bacterium]|nr:16S rRNA (cytosine(967)-C(5))-methyltransferase RsmB [Clostridiales bacterium]MBR6484362.1 16S rRNA (cytosine(967)-C(5))-methyltransferase RsmB [Clostridiales bacterium]